MGAKEVLNFNISVTLVYVLMYAFVFFYFLNKINDCNQLNENLYQLSLVFIQQKLSKTVLFIAFMSFIGVPPFVLFAPKFALLASVASAKTFSFFLIVFLAVVLSFALYVNALDIFFNKKQNHIIKTKKTRTTYSSLFSYSWFLFVCCFGLFFFKDFVFIITLFF